jgi:hypothetical protein
MQDFLEAYKLSRGRFEDAVGGLSQTQLNWRIQPGTLTIGESAMHVAGAEVNFISQLLGTELDEYGARLKRAATEGIVEDVPFPYSPEEMTPDAVVKALAFGRGMAEPIIASPSEAVRAKIIKSVLGPMIDGTGALARLAFHAGYHQGQA